MKARVVFKYDFTSIVIGLTAISENRFGGGGGSRGGSRGGWRRNSIFFSTSLRSEAVKERAGSPCARRLTYFRAAVVKMVAASSSSSSSSSSSAAAAYSSSRSFYCYYKIFQSAPCQVHGHCHRHLLQLHSAIH